MTAWISASATDTWTDTAFSIRKQAAGAISDKRNMFLFVENKKGETEGSYAPIYTVGKDGKPEVMCSSVSVHGGWNPTDRTGMP